MQPFGGLDVIYEIADYILSSPYFTLAENAEQDDVAVISPEWLRKWALTGYSMLYHKRQCVAHMCAGGGGRYSQREGGVGWKQEAVLIKQPLQLLPTWWIARRLLLTQHTNEGEKASCVSTVLYCNLQLCWALTRLQRKQYTGQRAA